MYMKQVITITGAGGTVGMSLTKYFLNTNADIEVRAIERSEEAVSRLIDIATRNKNLKIFLTDLINYADIEEILSGSNVIVHCAALKHVTVGSMFPEVLAYQNVSCFCNIVRAAKKHKVDKIILCSTDKSSTPTSVMGTSKLLLEKIACFSSNRFSKFAAVRFGNILNSSGSIIPRIISNLKNNEKININHKNMTRYILTENDFQNLITHALNNMRGGEVFIPNVKSLKIYDLITNLIELFCEKYNLSSDKIATKILKNPYNENVNERMVNFDEFKYLHKSGDYFVLKQTRRNKIINKQDDHYSHLLSSSENNLSKEEIKILLNKIGVI